uniref:KRAB domain-containing protein n=1 Tax=Podarcis muralis TaxID=64176 RepID=A0A670HPU0_PODMU
MFSTSFPKTNIKLRCSFLETKSLTLASLLEEKKLGNLTDKSPVAHFSTPYPGWTTNKGIAFLFQGSMSFEGVSLHFTDDECSLLDPGPRVLYKEVMMEIYEMVASVDKVLSPLINS